MSLNFVDLKYLNLLSGQLRNFKRINDRTYNFSCPLCGDGKNKRKARGYIYETKGDPRYKCHNCGASMRFHRLIEAVDSRLYSEYQLERIKEGMWKPQRRAPVVSSQPARGGAAALGFTPGAQDDTSPLSLLTKISELPPSHYARKFVEARMIPEKWHSKLYHCPRFYAWVNHFMPGKFSEGALKYDASRLIIPFLHPTRDLHAFQGRIYKGISDAKYITIKTIDELPKIFGLETLNTSQVTYATEGPIDSMFLPNAVAFSGGDHSTLSGYVSPDKTVLVYDNEPRSLETHDKLAKAIKAGWNVCIWPSTIRWKDINEMVQEGMSIGEIKDIIDNHTWKGTRAEIELAAWTKVNDQLRKDRRASMDRSTSPPRSRSKVSLEELFASR